MGNGTDREKLVRHPPAIESRSPTGLQSIVAHPRAARQTHIQEWLPVSRAFWAQGVKSIIGLTKSCPLHHGKSANAVSVHLAPLWTLTTHTCQHGLLRTLTNNSKTRVMLLPEKLDCSDSGIKRPHVPGMIGNGCGGCPSRPDCLASVPSRGVQVQA